MGRYTGKQCRLISMTFLTGSYFLVELVVGYATNSMALVADSFHMLSDLVALIIALISVKMAPKRWKKNTFGWARAEVLGALVNAVFLLALCFSILVESLKRFANPETILQPILILYVGAFGLLVNLIGLLLFRDHGHSHGEVSKKDQQTLPVYDDVLDEEVRIKKIRYNRDEISENKQVEKEKSEESEGKVVSGNQMNMRGVYLHILADALGSVIVIISALIIWLTDWSFRLYVDPTLSVVIVLLISKSTWPLMKQSSLIMLQTVPSHINIERLQKKFMKEIEGTLSVHEFHIWQLNGERIIATMHIMFRSCNDYINMAGKMKLFFHNEGIHSITVQPEFVETGPDEIIDSECAYECPPPAKCLEQTCCGAYDVPITNGIHRVNGSVRKTEPTRETDIRNGHTVEDVETGQVNNSYIA